MVDPETTGEAGASDSGLQSDAAVGAAPEPEGTPEPAQAESGINAGPQSTSALTSPVVAAIPATSTPNVLPHKRWWNRLGGVKLSASVTLAVLATLAALSIAGGLAFSKSALGQACAIAFVPGLSISIGYVATRYFAKQTLDEELSRAAFNAAYTTLHLKRSVRYIDERLRNAYQHMRTGVEQEALLEIVRALTAAELSFATAQQSSRQ